MDEVNTIRKRAIDFVRVATDGDYEAMERIGNEENPLNEDAILNVLREKDIPISGIVREDLQRLFEGETLKYFLPPDEVVNRYRTRYGIHFVMRDGGSRPLSDCAEIIADRLERVLDEVAEFGATLVDQRSGVACFAEQEFFYGTEEWKNLAKVVRTIDRLRCKECGTKKCKLHAHHTYGIYSSYSRRFYKNFDVGMIMTLCEKCHAGRHSRSIKSGAHFIPAFPPAKARERTYNINLRRLHDSAGECPYCFHRHQVVRE